MLTSLSEHQIFSLLSLEKAVLCATMLVPDFDALPMCIATVDALLRRLAILDSVSIDYYRAELVHCRCVVEQQHKDRLQLVILH